MKRYLPITMVILLVAVQGMAQTQPRAETFRSTDENIKVDKLTSFNMQYLLDAFTDGVVYSSARGHLRGEELNYNILLDAIQYYGPNGDLLSLFADQPIDSVVIGDYVLIPFQGAGFVQVFDAGDQPLMLRRNIALRTETLVRGAYGSIERTSSTERVNNLFGESSSGEIFNLDLRLSNASRDEIEVRLRYQEAFYIMLNGKPLELSNRRSTVRAFPDHSREVNSFIRQNNIDFDDPQSLAKLAAFLQSL
jgi:hypothetical protein